MNSETQKTNASIEQNFTKSFHSSKKNIEDLKALWHSSHQLDHKLSSNLIAAYKDICKLCLEAGKLEKALEHSNEALSLFEDEELSVINFLCLYNLKSSRLAEIALEKGLKKYPGNKLFKKYSFKIPLPEEKISERETQKESLPFKPESPGLNLMANRPNFSSPQAINLLENMGEKELGNMLGMMKSPEMQEQIKRIHGKNFSNEELQRMETMMTPQNLKMAMMMLKSNPSMLKEYESKLQENINLRDAQNTNTLLNETTLKNDFMHKNEEIFAAQNNSELLMNESRRNFARSDFQGNLQDMTSSDFAGGQFNQDLASNKGAIKMALGMFKENPKQTLEMLATMTKNSQLAAASQISERKLKILASLLYYFVIAFLEITGFVRKYKGQILVLIIAAFIYKYIL